MENLSLEEENIIKDITIIFILNRDIRKRKPEKYTKEIKDIRILGDIKYLF